MRGLDPRLVDSHSPGCGAPIGWTIPSFTVWTNVVMAAFTMKPGTPLGVMTSAVWQRSGIMNAVKDVTLPASNGNFSRSFRARGYTSWLVTTVIFVTLTCEVFGVAVRSEFITSARDLNNDCLSGVFSEIACGDYQGGSMRAQE
jgi:uncharacterized membrane protein